MALQATVSANLAGFDVLDARGAFQPAFPSADLVSIAAGLLDEFKSGAGLHGRTGRVFDGVVWQLSVGPGVIALGTRQWGVESGERLHGSTDQLELGTPEPVFDLLPDVHVSPRSRDADDYAWSEHVCDALDGARSDLDSAPRTRGRILGWSRKSRARMTRRLAELDYSPMFSTGQAPALTTLTMPSDWQASAPDGPTFKRHVQTFRKRYERAFGPLAGVWKLEFQRRGAPHLHLYHVPPTLAPASWHPQGCTCSTRHGFREWLSWTWAEVCDPKNGDRDGFMAHVRAGTNVDVREGMRSSDPRRLAVYFTKHGTYSAKEYQNQVPAEWGDTSPGRFWGYWNLDRAVESVELRPRVAVAAGRTLRRLADSKRVMRSVTVFEDAGLDRETGEILRRPRGTKLVPVKRMRGGRGFLCVNDAPALVAQLSRYLATVESVRPSGYTPIRRDPGRWP